MLLRAYALVSSLILVVVTTTAFRERTTAASFGEITVERVNVVDSNGMLRTG